jgi:hypothetical protein
VFDAQGLELLIVVKARLLGIGRKSSKIRLLDRTIALNGSKASLLAAISISVMELCTSGTKLDR